MPAPETTFAAVFEQLRLAKGWTPAELARRLDVSPTQVSRWRRGSGVPSIPTIQLISTLFGVDRETLETLAGYRASTDDREQDIVDAGMAAMVDAERADMKAQLRGIPEPFWMVILDAQRSARRVAVDSVKAAIGLAQGQPISTSETQPISSDVSASSQDQTKRPRGQKRDLTRGFGFERLYEQSANAQAMATA